MHKGCASSLFESGTLFSPSHMLHLELLQAFAWQGSTKKGQLLRTENIAWALLRHRRTRSHGSAFQAKSF